MTYLLAARAFLSRIPWQVYAALAIAAAWYWERDNHADAREAEVRAEMQAELDAAKAKADKAQHESAAEATVERVIETRTITIQQKARDNAIQTTNDGKPSDASNALNCQRLRSAGADIQHIPACGRRETGAETTTRP